MTKRFLMATAAIFLTAPGTAGASPATTFTPADIADWGEKRFAGHTDYRLVTAEAGEVVEARCDGAASAKVVEVAIDLDATPILEWSWRVPETFDPATDETTRAGNDFPAQVMVLRDGGWKFWESRGLSYVWASGQPAGSDWANPALAKAHMVAVESGPAKAGQWVTERRDLRDDFATYLGGDIGANRLAIMTDCDNRGGQARAQFGAIRLVPAG